MKSVFLLLFFLLLHSAGAASFDFLDSSRPIAYSLDTVALIPLDSSRNGLGPQKLPYAGPPGFTVCSERKRFFFSHGYDSIVHCYSFSGEKIYSRKVLFSCTNLHIYNSNIYLFDGNHLYRYSTDMDTLHETLPPPPLQFLTNETGNASWFYKNYFFLDTTLLYRQNKPPPAIIDLDTKKMIPPNDDMLFGYLSDCATCNKKQIRSILSYSGDESCPDSFMFMGQSEKWFVFIWYPAYNCNKPAPYPHLYLYNKSDNAVRQLADLTVMSAIQVSEKAYLFTNDSTAFFYSVTWNRKKKRLNPLTIFRLRISE